MIFGQNLGRQTEKAKQGILRYIWDRKLKAGDKIPAQAELSRHLGLGCATLDRAVKSLVQDGVLESRRRVGVFVRNASPEGLPGRSIGVAGLLLDTPHMFNWSMAYALQSELQRNGCQCTMFPFRDGYRKHPEFSDFPGLEYAVGQGGLHGLISIADFFPDKLLSGLENAGLQLCFSGSPALADCGVFIDTVGFMLESLEKLRERGFCSPRVLVGPGPLRHFSLPRLAQFLGHWPECRVPLDDLYLEGYGLEHGRTAARNVLALPPAERPDCMVLCDDIIAQGFFSELVRRQGSRIGYMPPGFCLRNRNAPIDFPCRDVVNYEVDCRRIAELTVRMLLTRLRTGSGEPAVQWLLPAPEKTAAE